MSKKQKVIDTVLSQQQPPATPSLQRQYSTTARLLNQRVSISGLISRPALNGKHGVATSYNGDTGRYIVTIEGTAETIALKPTHLRASLQTTSM